MGIRDGRCTRTVHLVLCYLLAWPAGQLAHAATYTVTSTANGGTGTLRWAIIRANDHPGPDRILPGRQV